MCKLGLKICLILRRGVTHVCHHMMCCSMASAWPLHGLSMFFLPSFAFYHHLIYLLQLKKHCGEYLSHYLDFLLYKSHYILYF